jgi:hypothetical protein
MGDTRRSKLASGERAPHDANMVSRLVDGRQIADLRDSAPAGPIRSLGRATGDQAGDVVDEGTATAAKRRSRRAA